MQRKTVFSILLLIYLRLLLVDDQDKGDGDTTSTNGSDDDDDSGGGDKPAPQGPGDIIVKGIVLNDYVDSDLGQDQGELDLQQQDTPGEVYEPSGEVYVPPAKDDTDD